MRRRLILTVRGVPGYTSPRVASALIRSAVRIATLVIVKDGLTPPVVGNIDPSQTHRLGISQLRQSPFTTLLARSPPMRAVPAR